MRSKRWSLLCLILLAAVGLIIGSGVWSPHVLRGQGLLEVGGCNCTFNKVCENKDCSSKCTGDKYSTCTGSGGSSTVGCYVINSGNQCGKHKTTGENCGAQVCGKCYRS